MVERQNRIEEFLLKDRSVFVLGPRATGKSYYLKSVFSRLENVFVIDLLSRASYQRYLKEPGRFYDEVKARAEASVGKLYILVDEIQLLPDLLFEVHRLIEEFKGKCIFALTGSSARKIKRNESDLLAGRALGFKFFPFTSREVNFASNLDKVLQFGSLPEVFLESDESIVVEILRTYTEKYLREEIQQESLVRNLSGFSRFLELAAFANGEPLNYSKIARAAGVSSDTVKEYYQILEDTLLGTLVPAWEFSVRKQLTKAPKFYFFDTGIVNSLKGELLAEVRSSSYRYGRLFETMVVNELFRTAETDRLPCRFYHYRTNHGQEIDLIIQKNIASEPIAVEIKSSTSPSFSDVKQLAGFKDEHPDSTCLVLCNTPNQYNEQGIAFYPWKTGLEVISGLLT